MTTTTVTVGLVSRLPLWILQWLLACGILCWIGRLIVMSWTHRSAKHALFALGLTAGFGLLFTPWTSLTSFQSSNPDALAWHPFYQCVAYAWFTVLAGSLLSTALICAPIRRLALLLWVLVQRRLFRASRPGFPAAAHGYTRGTVDLEPIPLARASAPGPGRPALQAGPDSVAEA